MDTNKLLYLKRLLDMDDNRIPKQVYIKQSKLSLPKSWFEEINAIQCKYGLEEYNDENIPKRTKRKWKMIIKDQINKLIQDLIKKNTSTKTKYPNLMQFEEANKIIRYRLCMIDLNAYFVKNNKYCELCKCENEDLYNVIECK